MTTIAQIKHILDSRLAVLKGLLNKAEQQIGADKLTELLSARLAPDMFPLGRQISTTGSLARLFALWCAGQPTEVTDEDFTDLAKARAHLAAVRGEVAAIAVDDSRLADQKPMQLPGDIKFSLSGADYANEWVIPNLYFHLVTSYNILRANGVDIGKREYMGFLLPVIMAQMAAKG